MTITERLHLADEWASSRTELGFDILRVFLGVALFVRGMLFLADTNVLWQDTRRLGWFGATIIVHYVIVAHLAAGLCLAAGFKSRLAALALIPAPFGAAIFLHAREGLLSANQSLELAVLVLVMLIVFAVFGPGRLSADHYISRTPPAPYDPSPGPPNPTEGLANPSL